MFTCQKSTTGKDSQIQSKSIFHFLPFASLFLSHFSSFLPKSDMCYTATVAYFTSTYTWRSFKHTAAASVDARKPHHFLTSDNDNFLYTRKR